VSSVGDILKIYKYMRSRIYLNGLQNVKMHRREVFKRQAEPGKWWLYGVMDGLFLNYMFLSLIILDVQE